MGGSDAYWISLFPWFVSSAQVPTQAPASAVWDIGWIMWHVTWLCVSGDLPGRLLIGWFFPGKLWVQWDGHVLAGRGGSLLWRWLTFHPVYHTCSWSVKERNKSLTEIACVGKWKYHLFVSWLQWNNFRFNSKNKNFGWNTFDLIWFDWINFLLQFTKHIK